MKLSSLPLFSEKSLVKGLVFLNLSLLYKGQNDSYNKFTKNYAGNDDMTKKEKEIYPRSRKEMLRIIKTAEKEGHLLETALEEWLEKAVLRLMAQGMSNDEIANKMGKKMGTVKFHSNNIFRKLQVQNRQQAVNRGREINLL